MLFIDSTILKLLDDLTRVDRDLYLIALVWFFQRIKYHERQ